MSKAALRRIVYFTYISVYVTGSTFFFQNCKEVVSKPWADKERKKKMWQLLKDYVSSLTFTEHFYRAVFIIWWITPFLAPNQPAVD